MPAWLTVHPANPASIRSSLTYARTNARTVRDRVSTEMSEAVNHAYLELAIGRDDTEEDALHDYCVAVREASHLVLGIAHATLPRDLGWYFVRAGQYVERADTIVRMLSVRTRHDFGTDAVAAGLEAHRSMAMLKSTSAYEAFRKRHRRTPTRETIAAFLLLEPDFPRSLRYCLTLLDEVLAKIAAANPGTSREPQRQAGWLAAQIAYCPDVGRILDDEEPGLDALLDAIAALSTRSAARTSCAPDARRARASRARVSALRRATRRGRPRPPRAARRPPARGARARSRRGCPRRRRGATRAPAGRRRNRDRRPS